MDGWTMVMRYERMFGGVDKKKALGTRLSCGSDEDDRWPCLSQVLSPHFLYSTLLFPTSSPLFGHGIEGLICLLTLLDH